ncbi:hypothetical protein [Nocardia lasii]|uniref:DUF456 domain-containing protein n=1 Tax=Nocardia lasii TaxID=1616107 RepID=A0ABW1JSJ1_9NOCA
MGSVVAAGAVPLIMALVGTGTANADPTQAAVTQSDQAAPGVDTVVADAVVPANTRSSLQNARSGPEQDYLSPVGTLHAPTAVTPVAPILPPPGQFRFGDQLVPVPDFVPVDASIQINDASARTEADLATFLDSVGLERSRSDRIAAETIGSAVRGAAIGNTLASPIAMLGAPLGAVAGLVAGIPLLPVGLVAGPILGAAVAYMAVSLPFTAVGAGIGAAVGAASGFLAPAHGETPADSEGVLVDA